MDECVRQESGTSPPTTTVTNDERRFLRGKCAVSWKTLKRFTPNRGHYDIAASARVCKITSALLWFCPGSGQPEDTLATGEFGDLERCNYQRAVENQETMLISRLPGLHALSKTFTKKALKRKCRPPLRSVHGEFQTCESFLQAVSIIRDREIMNVFLFVLLYSNIVLGQCACQFCDLMCGKKLSNRGHNRTEHQERRKKETSLF